MSSKSRVFRFTSRLAIAAMAAIVGFEGSSGAQVTPIIDPPSALNHNAVPDIGSNHDQFVDLETDRKGVWIAVWDAPADDTTVDCSGSSNGKCGPDGDIMYSVSQDFGDTWTNVKFLNTDAESDGFADETALIATDRKGNWVVVWSRSNEAAVSRSVNNGQTWSAPQVLSDVELTFGLVTEKMDLATDRNGVWILTWSSNGQDSGGDFDIFVTRSLDAGVTWSAPAAVNPAFSDDPVYDDLEPAIATDGYDNWIVTWESDSQANGWGADPDILAATSTNDGVSWSSPVAVNDDATTDSYLNSHDRRPDIATDSHDNWVVVWEEFSDSASPTGVDPDILWSRSTNLGATWSASQPVDPNANADSRLTEMHPTIETDGNGIWNVAWTAGVSVETDLLISTSNNNGTAWTGFQVLNTQALSDNGDDHLVDLAVDNSGNWVAVWQSTDDLSGTVYADNDIFVTDFGIALVFPVNDLALNAFEISPGGHAGSFSGAETDGLASCGAGGEGDVWYRFQHPDEGVLIVDTCGSYSGTGVDTVVSIHTDAPGTTGNEIGCDDDWVPGAPTECTGSLRDSSLEVGVGSEPVWIRVARYPGSSEGEFNLNIGYVPEPAGIVLLASGIVGLFGLRKLRHTRR